MYMIFKHLWVISICRSFIEIDGWIDRHTGRKTDRETDQFIHSEIPRQTE